MIGLLGRKFGMTQIFDSKGNNVPVTVIEAGPCQVISLKNKEKHGYASVELGFIDVAEKKVNKARLGKFKKINLTPKQYVREIRTEKIDGLNVGDNVYVSTFKTGDYVDICGVSIGKGFQGVVKRHHFAGGGRSHGSMFGRVPGSIGQSSFPSRVFKGLRAAGHMGNENVTIQNIEVVHVDGENNLLVVKGQVPGFEGQMLVIKNSKKLGAKDKVWKTTLEVEDAPKEKSELGESAEESMTDSAEQKKSEKAAGKDNAESKKTQSKKEAPANAKKENKKSEK